MGGEAWYYNKMIDVINIRSVIDRCLSFEVISNETEMAITSLFMDGVCL